MNEQKTTRRRKAAGVVSLLLILALILSGTFAWVYTGEHKTNEASNEGTFEDYDVRLIEDFITTTNWSTSNATLPKKVSVINMGSSNYNSTGVWVSLVLKEYLEVGDITPNYTYYTCTDSTHACYKMKIRFLIGHDDDVGTPPISIPTLQPGYDGVGRYICFNDPDPISGVAANGTVNEYAHLQAQGAYPPTGTGRHIEWLTDYVTGQTGWFVSSMEDDINGQYGRYVLTDVTTTQGVATSVVPDPTAAFHQPGWYANTNQSAEAVIEYSSPTGHHNAFANEECYYPDTKISDVTGAWLNTGDPGTTGGRVSITAPIRDYVDMVFTPGVLMTYADYVGVNNSQPCAKWVYYEDGSNSTIFWGEKLMPGVETTDLLNELTLIADPGDFFYYAMHIDMYTSEDPPVDPDPDPDPDPERQILGYDYGGNGSEEFYDVVAANDIQNGYVSVGYTRYKSENVVDAAGNDQNWTNPNSDYYGALIVKSDASGHAVTTNVLGAGEEMCSNACGSMFYGVTAVPQTADDQPAGYVAVGYGGCRCVHGAGNFVDRNGLIHAANMNHRNTTGFLIVRFDENLNVLWYDILQMRDGTNPMPSYYVQPEFAGFRSVLYDAVQKCLVAVGYTAAKFGTAVNLTGTAVFYPNISVSDAVIARYRLDGGYQAHYVYGGYGNESRFYDVALDTSANGGYVAVGYSEGNQITTHSTFPLPTYATTWGNAGGVDGIIVNLDTGLKQRWAYNVGSTNWDVFYGITKNWNNPGYMVVGGSDNGSVPGLWNAVGCDAIAVSFSSNGTALWGKSYGGIAGSKQFFHDVVAVDDGGFVAVGESVSASNGLNFNWGNVGNCDGIVVKIDANGVDQWTKNAGSIKDDRLRGVAAIPYGYVAVGSTWGDGSGNGGTSIGLDRNWGVPGAWDEYQYNNDAIAVVFKNYH